MSRLKSASALFAAVAMLALTMTLATAGTADARPGRASIVVEWESGRVLRAYRADKLHAPASLTKVMTLYLTFQALDNRRLKLHQRLLVSRRATYATPSKLYLRAGSTITVKQAILALVTKSANDAAVVLAEALGGSERTFARMMTMKARQLGMSRTTFRNASGLPARGQITTARDMAIMARSVISRFPHHYHYFGTRSFYFQGRRYGNHNRLLGRYPGVDGLKTGYVRASGFNLITSARNRAGYRIIAVVLGGRSSRDRDLRMTMLLNGSLGKNRLYAGAAGRKRHVNLRQTQRKAMRFQTAHGYAGPRRSTTRTRTVRARKASSRYSRRGGWGVQVGAFTSYRRARRAVRMAARRSPRQLSRATPEIAPTRSGRSYRARLRGVSKRQAYQACRRIVRFQRRCAIVKPNGRAYRFGYKRSRRVRRRS